MKRALELEITRKGRPVHTIEATLDPDNPGPIREVLTSWLAADGWDEGRWGEFEVIVRNAGEWKQLKKIRAV